MTDTDKPAKKPPGRPPSPTGRNGRNVNVYLGKAALDAASRLGAGNVSAGIRLALERVSSRDAMNNYARRKAAHKSSAMADAALERIVETDK